MSITPYAIHLKKQYSDTLKLIIEGELDESNAEAAFAEITSQTLDEQKVRHIACDFSGLTYTNSTTLGYLTNFIARAHRLGKTISFDRVHPKTQHIFDMVGLSKVVDQPLK